jgi:dipeptidyl aminopeptidase/acylaminoacyl peptidase
MPPSSDLPTAPFGSWPSPITADLVVQASVSLGGPAFGGGDLWWSELRPAEGGRVQIVRKALDAGPEGARDVLPEGFSARTRVHEYGGGAWWLHGETLFFANWADQRLYRLDPGAAPVALTPEPGSPHALRYADGIVTPDGRWVVCVREVHGMPGATEARNQLVALPSTGGEPVVLVGQEAGTTPVPDFVSDPRLSPDGHLCWLQWFHPDMPWDATELWVADLTEQDGIPVLGRPERVAGGPGISVSQPRWGPAGRLWFVSDHRPAGIPGPADEDGWWTLYVYPGRGRPGPDDRPVVMTHKPEAEFGGPQWVFGQASYAVAEPWVVPNDATPATADPDAGPDADAEIPQWLAVRRQHGRDVLAAGPGGGDDFDQLTNVEQVAAGAGGTFALVGGSFTAEPQVFTLRRAGGAEDPLHYELVVERPARDLGIGPAWFSEPEHVTFPVGDGAVAHALFYAPANPEVNGPEGERPPLIVLSHGGPTAAARPQLSLALQFWTSRGFAVVDVNYRGSTGYGRPYREALNGAWGIVDVDDCLAAARHLAAEGRVDGRRLLIRGSSAGGYTTLQALTGHDDFAAGTSLYGVADLEALARDTHKFESRYTDRLVGPYPEARATYVERSPLTHADRLATPLLILQGLEDEIVPPAQAEMMVDALRAKRIPFAYLTFPGEQHGFRQAATIRRALEAELYFYGRVLGFTPADDLEPVPIEFL